MGAEILDLLKRNELHDTEHRIQQLLREKDHDDWVGRTTPRGLAAVATLHDGAAGSKSIGSSGGWLQPELEGS